MRSDIMTLSMLRSTYGLLFDSPLAFVVERIEVVAEVVMCQQETPNVYEDNTIRVVEDP